MARREGLSRDHAYREVVADRLSGGESGDATQFAPVRSNAEHGIRGKLSTVYSKIPTEDSAIRG